MRKWIFAALAAWGAGVGMVSAADIAMADLATHLGVEGWATSYVMSPSLREVVVQLTRFDRDKSGKFVGGESVGFNVGRALPLKKEAYRIRVLASNRRLTLFVDGSSGGSYEQEEPFPPERVASDLPSQVKEGSYLLLEGYSPAQNQVEGTVDSDGTVHVSDNVVAYLLLTIRPPTKASDSAAH